MRHHARIMRTIDKEAAGPLTQLAVSISAALAPGGMLVLSGLLHNQENMILSFYHRLRFVSRHRDGPWSALVLEKPL